MVTVAAAKFEDDFIVPIPFELFPSQRLGDEHIIVAIDDIPPSKKTVKAISDFYGSENYKMLTGKMPTNNKEKCVFCVSPSCILDRATSHEGKLPPQSISPLWTKDRFGISAEEATIVNQASYNMTTKIHMHMKEFRSKLDEMLIKIDLRTIKDIEKYESIINQAHSQIEEMKLECRIKSAEKVAQFIETKFPVEAWVDSSLEPTVMFFVKEEIADNEAVVIGLSVEGVLNEIEPTNYSRFFNKVIPDASVFPIVMDVSFVRGKRIASKYDYLMFNPPAEDHSQT